MRITRDTKKKLRAIILCHTGNPECRKSKYSKRDWLIIKEEYSVWLSAFSRSERRVANTV